MNDDGEETEQDTFWMDQCNASTKECTKLRRALAEVIQFIRLEESQDRESRVIAGMCMQALGDPDTKRLLDILNNDK